MAVESDPAGPGSATPVTLSAHRTPIAPPTKRERVGLELIAAYSFVKAAALLGAALAALGLLNARVSEAASDWLEYLALRHESRLAGRMADHVLPYLDRATGRHLIEIAAGAFFFATVYVVEGVGLWRCKRWAEYLTIGVSASFLPFEMIALFRRVSAPLLVTFILNVLVVAFLMWQVRAGVKRAEESHTP